MAQYIVMQCLDCGTYNSIPEKWADGHRCHECSTGHLVPVGKGIVVKSPSEKKKVEIMQIVEPTPYKPFVILKFKNLMSVRAMDVAMKRLVDSHITTIPGTDILVIDDNIEVVVAFDVDGRFQAADPD